MQTITVDLLELVQLHLLFSISHIRQILYFLPFLFCNFYNFITHTHTFPHNQSPRIFCLFVFVSWKCYFLLNFFFVYSSNDFLYPFRWNSTLYNTISLSIFFLFNPIDFQSMEIIEKRKQISNNLLFIRYRYWIE